jgi:hypothetical protein
VRPGARAAAPNSRQTNPEQAIESGQNRPLPLSPEGRELQPQGGILDRHGLVAAEQESNESNQEQHKRWHVS